MARPMPLPDPVISKTLPSTSIGSSFWLNRTATALANDAHARETETIPERWPQLYLRIGKSPPWASPGTLPTATNSPESQIGAGPLIELYY